MPIKVKQNQMIECAADLEPCCFCGTGTALWVMPQDVACCRPCAAKHRPSELPTKEEWFRQTLARLRQNSFV